MQPRRRGAQYPKELANWALVSVGGGLRYWADSPPNGPEGLGVRVVFTLLVPR